MFKFIGCTTGILSASYAYRIFNKVEKVSEDEVIHTWLKAESTDPHHQFANAYQQSIARYGVPQLTYPNFHSTEENIIRRKIFNEVRGKYYLWNPIYKHTIWYKTRIILNNPFRTIVAPYHKDVKQSDPDLNNIILWGHSIHGPLVVLEGNHRWNARNKWFPYISTVYIGVSNKKYHLHSDTGCKSCENK